MQDISLLPEWNKEDVIQGLERNPLDHKTMKNKLDRIYQITFTNQLQYVPDVLDAYCWIRLAHQMDDFKKFFPTQKNEKQFYEDFVATSIRYMIICKRFKNKVMMVLTQYMMVEALKLFKNKLGLLEKYLKMVSILNCTFDHEKQFYKINYSVETVDRIISHKSIIDVNFDDSNDEKNDPEMKERFVLRGDICSSQLYLDLLNFAHNQLDLFNVLLQAVVTKRFNIEAISEIISFLMHIHAFFHRKWALEYIPQLTQGILDFINKGDDITIRNFSKQRFEAVITSVREFLKRVKTLEQRKQIVEEFQLNLICRFLFSDFLDRKLQAVSILTTFMKYSKNTLVKSKQDFVEWIREKQILKAIYNDKSHEELIGRSSEFLQYYLLQKPNIEELNPLLQLTDPNIKLISQIFEYFPKEFQSQVVEKIKEKENVTNKEALNIIKQTPGCEEWLLKNGGQCWVEVMRQKTKRKADIAQVFNQDFKVVKKITKEISDLYEGKFKTQFFLYMNEINYVSTVLQNNDIALEERLKYVALALEPLSQINEITYKSILPFTTKTVDNLSEELQTFFVNLLDKLSRSHLRDLFQRNFEQKEDLSQLGLGQMAIFKKCFLLINEEQKNIEKKITFSYISPNSYRKQKKEHLTIKVNPNSLNGMTQLMTIIFENKNIAVSQEALQFIGFLFDRLDETLIDSVSEFKSKILESCLEEFYKTEDQQEKYLKIIEKLMNESQKDGTDQVPSVDSLFPSQMITIRVIDHFNVNKSKITMQVASNITLYELRVHIGRTLNAYVNEMKILLNGEEIDPRLNGHIIHTLNLSGEDLIIEKKITIDKVTLCLPDGGLNDKVKRVLSGMFKEYSTLGLMSKPQCQKYQQRCIGEVTSMSQTRVDKIYEQYDTDKDGYLTEADFLKFYQVSATSKESAVWSNLETFGVRNDLEILNEQEITYPDGELLTRNLLFKNETFVDKLVLMIQSTNETQAKAAWKIISRLPLIRKPLEQFDIEQRYAFRYWLYLVEDAKQYNLVTKEILRKTLQSDIETACIGLTIAHQCTEFDVEIFNITISNMKKVVNHQTLTFYNKVLLDNSLKLFDSCLRLNKDIRSQFIEKQPEYRAALTTGLMSHNHDIRVMYCKIVEELIGETYANDFEIFSIFFNLIYKNFEKCDKSTLNIEYFDLYSNLLEVLQNHPELYEKLKLNEEILAKSMVQLYKEHRCTETSLNSKPDHVSQGFLRILGKLLNKETQQIMIPFVGYLFQNSLFPEHGHNKLKNSKTRKDAYQLIYEICSLKTEKGESLGLAELFNSGFKSVYKKMNQNKPTAMSFSYYCNYNEARSELGYAGLRNLGCICYMIAMLQQLFMTKAFRYLILMADDKEPECLVKKGTKEIDDNIFHQLKNMFANLELTQKQEYNPEDFCFAFKDFEGQPINVTVQQDAQQFINLFFDKMQESLKKTPFRRIFSDVYGGKNCNLTVCSNCNAANERYENFYPLSLQVKGYKSIEAAFQKYITGEVISDYQCDSCQKKTDVTKSCYLASTPNYFILHLTRMCFNYDKFENEKVNGRWEFPHKLNLWEYSLDKHKGLNSKEEFDYELKGVVLHYGTADFGHYFSYIKESDSMWIEFNDERVREFDPRDIQTDCFGGENWRRESQSAYLLVYEKVQKRPIVLEFETQEEKEISLNLFGLRKAVIETEAKLQKNEQQLLEEEAKEKQSQAEIKTKPEQSEKPKILVSLDPMKIQPYVPEDLRQKISKANEQFSFSLNLSNDEFAYFLYKILSIQPPDELTTEYLQLCYECFHLKQIVEEESSEGNSLTLSEWAAKRFKEIVKGHGWEFLKNFGKNWESDILSIEKSTRVGIKNLLECVISDIIQSNNLNNELEETENEAHLSEEGERLKVEKREIILQFLEKYTEMMSNDVTKHWHRFREYFEVWLTLVEQNSFVRRYCQEKMMVEKILDFVLQDESPFTPTKKKYSMGNNYYSAEFEYPLQFITLLIKQGYQLNDMQNKCMRYYAFMSKVINFQTKYFNIVQYLCKDDELLSEKMAFLILHQAAKVNQSDAIKPVVNVIHKYLDIDDALKEKRKEWILGTPQHIENSKTGSHGVWNVNVEQEYVLTYFSPVRAQPILLQLLRFKTKAQHVAALLLAMLLQLEADGHITNLEQYPAMEAFEKNYTHWFEEFVDSYYEDTHRPYMAKNYVEYGNRLKALWTDRPHREYEKLPFYLIGKSVQKTAISEQTHHQGQIELKVEDVTSELLEITEENSFLNKKNIKSFEGSENFRVKTSYYTHSTFLPLDRGLHSSDEENTEEKPLVNPFQNKITAVLFRKCIIKNLSNENLLLTFKVTEQGEKNTLIPESAISFDIRADSTNVISLYKKDLSKDFGELKYHINVLGKATKEGYWPKEIITPVVEEDKTPAAPDAKVGSDDESNEDFQ